MESTTISPNGAVGAAAAHSLASPDAEQVLGQILATPFAEADPPADLPPDLPPDLPEAADIEPEMPHADDPFTILPPVPDANEPDAEPAAEEPPSLPEGMGPFLPEGVTAAEPEAAAAQPEQEAPAAEPAVEPASAEQTWQPGDFAKYKDKYIVEITTIHQPLDPSRSPTFNGYTLALATDTGILARGELLTGRSLSNLKPIEKVTTLLKLKIGQETRIAAELDRQATQHANSAEKLQRTLDAYIAAKEAISQLVPDAKPLTW